MKYFVMYTANGELAINSITEFTSLDQAKAQYHDVCKLMWSDATVQDASVAILNNEMEIITQYREGIHKTPTAPEPEPEV